jgi:hypothetical protein
LDLMTPGCQVGTGSFLFFSSLLKNTDSLQL